MSEPHPMPTDPADARLLLQALVDGELDAAASLALERQLAADPHLQAEHARLLALKGAMARLPRAPVDAGFAARMAALVSDDSAASDRVPSPGASHVLAEGTAETHPNTPVPLAMGMKASRARPSAMIQWPVQWRALAASLLLGAVLASGATYWLTAPRAPTDIAQAVASGHRRALLAASAMDVASADTHTVKPWLDARLGVSPPAPDLAAQGFALVGGRVEVIGTTPVPALVYRHREHLITLLAMPLGRENARAEPVDASAGGFPLVHWEAGGFAYWAVSDMSRADLDGFVHLFRAAAAAAADR